MRLNLIIAMALLKGFMVFGSAVRSLFFKGGLHWLAKNDSTLLI
jgi:hypothetical protein